MKDKSFMLKNLMLALLVVLIVVIPLFIAKDAEFGGADGQAEEIISQLDSNYQPWFKPLWEPPSGEIESLLFALQAAAGAGFIGYYIGYYIGQARVRKNANR